MRKATLLLVLLSFNVVAQSVYRCDVDGVPTYTQQPCSDDAAEVYTPNQSDRIAKRGSADTGMLLLNAPVAGQIDKQFKQFFIDNYKNKHVTTTWAKYVIGLEKDSFTRYIIIADSLPANHLMLLCSQIRSYNLSKQSTDGKLLSGIVRTKNSNAQLAYYSPSFDECSAANGKRFSY